MKVVHAASRGDPDAIFAILIEPVDKISRQTIFNPKLFEDIAVDVINTLDRPHPDCPIRIAIRRCRSDFRSVKFGYIYRCPAAHRKPLKPAERSRVED